MSEVQQAIKQSQRTDTIVHIPYSDEAYDELVAASENFNTPDEYTVDAWGCNPDGDWRVILDRRWS